ASAFFPALVLGIVWSRANKWGALCAMGTGLLVTLYYLIRNEPWLRSFFHIDAPVALWFGILPVSAGAFGVPVGFAVCVVVSLATPAPSAQRQQFVLGLRDPGSR
ncbi:MAG: cation acetate symporter, partial [Burkholderiaceae bacterium]